jgi:hypothetical protein
MHPGMYSITLPIPAAKFLGFSKFTIPDACPQEARQIPPYSEDFYVRSIVSKGWGETLTVTMIYKHRVLPDSPRIKFVYTDDLQYQHSLDKLSKFPSQARVVYSYATR